MIKKNFDIKFRVWFNSDGEKLLGKGRVELLERINDSGSIASAAKEMKMSYRQAWQMVKEMNERSNSPLVEKKLGGKSGGGASITLTGKELIELFHDIENKVQMFLEGEVKKIEL